MKKAYLVDAEIACMPPMYIYRYGRHYQLELQEKTLEEWVRDFDEFIHDHKSRDTMYVDIRRTYEEKCEYCHREWQEDERGCPICCDKAVEEWMEQNGEKI